MTQGSLFESATAGLVCGTLVGVLTMESATGQSRTNTNLTWSRARALQEAKKKRDILGRMVL